MLIDKDRLIARFKEKCFANGGTYIIPECVYEIIEEEAEKEALEEQKGRVQNPNEPSDERIGEE